MLLSAAQTRLDLAERLQARRAEIEQAVLTRVQAIADPREAADPRYAEGLRITVTAALDYGLRAIERGEERSSEIPVALLGQARLAARNAVSLETVLRRYFAGYALLGDFLLAETEAGGLLEGASLKDLQRAQAAVFERVIAAVSEEYARERQSHARSTEERRTQRIQALLDGETLDTSEIAYEFEAAHLGAIAAGPGAAAAIRDLARCLDCRLLLVDPGGDSAWAWLGARRPLDPAELGAQLAEWPQTVSLAFGEPARGLAGWRLTHRQARAALPIALRREEASVRYAEVALLAAIVQDDLLSASLQELFLAPLEAEPDEGELMLKTLHAYFAADCNLSSAAARLGVSRHTVRTRLRAIEERLGRTLAACGVELRMALQLQHHLMTDPPDRA